MKSSKEGQVKGRSTLDRVTGNAFWSLLRYASGWIALVLVPPFLIHHMSAPAYGTWMLLLQFGSYITFFDSTMQTAVARYVGRADGAHDREYLTRILASVLVLLMVGATFAFLLTGVSVREIARIFPKIPVDLQLEARHALLLIGSSLCIALPFTTLSGAYLGLQRNRVITTAIVCAKVVSSCGMVWSALHHASLVQLATWFSLGVMMPPIVYVLEWFRCRDDLPLKLGVANLQLIREFGGFYLSLAVNTISAIFISGLDIPVVARFDFAAVGVYSLATIFGNMLLIPQGAVVAVAMPAVANMSATRSEHELGRALLKFARYSSASMCALTVGLALGAPILLRLWLGADLSVKVLPFAYALLTAQVILLTAEPFQVMALATGRQAKLLPAWFISAAVNITCSIIFARHIGAVGVALGTLIGSVAGLITQYLLSMPRTDTISMRRWHYLQASILEPAIACLPAVVLLIVLWFVHWNVLFSGVFVALCVPLSTGIIVLRTFSSTEVHEMLVALKIRRRAVVEQPRLG